MSIKTSRDGIVLDDATHTYIKKDGTKAVISSTGICGLYGEKFNPQAVLDKLTESGKVKNRLHRAHMEYEWANSALIGTFFHKCLEEIISGGAKEEDFKEFMDETPEQVANVLEWLRDTYDENWEYTLEYTTFIDLDEENFVGCQLDVMRRHKTERHRFEIFDFKFTKTLDGKAYGKKMSEPLEKVSDSKQNKYFLQANVYKKAIEQEFEGAVVERMVLLHSQPEKFNPFTKKAIPARLNVIEVKDMDKQVELMLEDYKNNKLKK